MEAAAKSLRVWKEAGEYILMATAYSDRVLAKGRGSRVWDVDGRELIDLESGQICSLVGHNHPELVRRLAAQMERLLHTGTGFLSEPVFEAARKMARITPGDLKKSIFLSTGAEANECAFRIAKAATGKRGIVGFHKGYSGLTLATTSASLNARITSFTVPGTFKILAPDCPNCLFGLSHPECGFQCLRASFELLRYHCENQVAAFIVEPILSAGGMIFPPPGYFPKLKREADRIGALLIADEAQTGLGRTGTWFAMEAEGVVPDILVTSKGVGGGFPVSCVTVSDRVAQAASEGFSHFSSHQCDPVAAEAVSAVIDIVEQENLRENARSVGAYFLEGLKNLGDEYPVLHRARGRGLMIGVDLRPLPERNMGTREVAGWFQHLCAEEGVHVKPIAKGRVLRILPPLTITRGEVDEVLQAFRSALAAISAGRVKGPPPLPRNRYTRAMEARRRRSRIKRMAIRVWRSSPQELVERLTTVRGR